MKRLRSVILQRIGIVACVSFLVSAAFTWYYFEHILVDQIILEDRAKLDQTVRQLEYVSDDIANFAFTLIISDTIQSFYKTYNRLETFEQFAMFRRTLDYLDNYKGLRKGVTSFALVLEDGQVFWSEAGYDAYFGGKLKEPWYTNFIRSGEQFAFTEPHPILLTGNSTAESTVISFIVVVKDIEQPAQTIGKFIINLDYSLFRTLLDFGSAGFEGLVWLNGAGHVLYEKSAPGAGLPVVSLVEEAIGKGADTVETWRGVTLVERFEKHHWRIGAVISKRSLIERSKVVIYLLGIFSLVSTALILLLMMPAIFRITRPIMRLYQAMNAVSSGNLNVSVAIRTGDELERLGQGFNRMVRQLRVHLEESIRHEKEKRELELDLLLSQLNPHFVYNTLNAVIYMARKHGNDDIVRMVGAFIRLLQDAARTGDAHAFVPLRDDISLLRDYIAIQSYRYAGMFEVVWELEEEAMDCLVPRNLIQPFVENAIFHGICPKEGVKGMIRISAGVAEDTLWIRVEDDGIGIEPERLSSLWEKPPTHKGSGLRHIGLANTRKRLEHLFGGRAELRIDSVPMQGTVVSIRLPVRREQPEREDRPHDIRFPAGNRNSSDPHRLE